MHMYAYTNAPCSPCVRHRVTANDFDVVLDSAVGRGCSDDAPDFLDGAQGCHGDVLVTDCEITRNNKNK